MHEFRALEQLERITGLNDKKRVITKNLHIQEFKDLVTAALSFSQKFYVKKFNISEPQEQPLANSHQKFLDLLAVLSSRQLTGNAAVSAIEGFLDTCDEKQQKWYSRVLKKDLRCGISVKTANQAGINIPVFDVMLATDSIKCKKLSECIEAGVYVSPKLDGYRCIAIKEGDDVSLYSRNGSVYDNFPEIEEILKQIPGDFILDGEIMSDDFQSIQKSAFASTRGTTVGDLQYHVFGFIPKDEWESKEFTTNTADRIALLDTWFESNTSDKIVKVPQQFTNDLNDIDTLEIEYIEAGYEGLMIIPNIPYYVGRKANSLMKIKRMETMDVQVIDTYVGEGKYENKLGGLVVVQDNHEACKVGSGFTDEDREYMWNNKDSLIGRIAEIKYQEITADGIMRFPIFLRWRDQGQDTDKI